MRCMNDPTDNAFPPSRRPQARTAKAGRPNQRTSRVTRVEDIAPDDPLLGFAPYVHVAPRRNSITPDKQRRFIAMLAATGIVSQAARSVGASMEALYKLRHRAGAEGFARAWDAAVERGYSRLEDCALERAIAGEERPVVSRGKVVATWTRHNAGLLMFLLRARRPERYGTVKLADLHEGNPVYDALRRKWEREEDLKSRESEEAVRQSLHAKLLQMRDEIMAARAQTPGDAGRDSSGVVGNDDICRRSEAQGIGHHDHIGNGARLIGGEPLEAGEEGAAGL